MPKKIGRVGTDCAITRSSDSIRPKRKCWKETNNRHAIAQTKCDKESTVCLARRPPKFSWVIEGLLAGHGRPTLPGHVQYLSDNAVSYIVTFTLNRPRALMNLPDSISWVHVPIQDNTPPTLEQIHYVVALIDKAKMEGRRISVHCAWGRGRTGTMLACYLAKQLNLSADEAIARIRQLRPGSVDTEEQENVIRSFVNEMSAAHK